MSNNSASTHCSQPLSKEPIPKEPIKSVLAAIFSEDRKSILLIQRKDIPVWVLPGGGIDQGEEPSEAAIRETREESGYTVGSARYVGTYFKKFPFLKTTNLYECTITNPTPSPFCPEEVLAVDFFPLNALPKTLPPPFREYIEDALKRAPPFQKYIVTLTWLSIFKGMISHPNFFFRFIYMRIRRLLDRG